MSELGFTGLSGLLDFQDKGSTMLMRGTLNPAHPQILKILIQTIEVYFHIEFRLTNSSHYIFYLKFEWQLLCCNNDLKNFTVYPAFLVQVSLL